MTGLLASWEKIKKNKHGKHCHDHCSFFGRNSREGTPSRNLSIESSHGREKGRNPFTSMGVGKQMHCNLSYEVLLTDDLWSTAPQSPVGTGAGLESRIVDWAGRLNCTPG